MAEAEKPANVKISASGTPEAVQDGVKKFVPTDSEEKKIWANPEQQKLLDQLQDSANQIEIIRLAPNKDTDGTLLKKKFRVYTPTNRTEIEEEAEKMAGRGSFFAKVCDGAGNKIGGFKFEIEDAPIRGQIEDDDEDDDDDNIYPGLVGRGQASPGMFNFEEDEEDKQEETMSGMMNDMRKFMKMGQMKSMMKDMMKELRDGKELPKNDQDGDTGKLIKSFEDRMKEMQEAADKRFTDYVAKQERDQEKREHKEDLRKERERADKESQKLIDKIDDIQADNKDMIEKMQQNHKDELKEIRDEMKKNPDEDLFKTYILKSTEGQSDLLKTILTKKADTIDDTSKMVGMIGQMAGILGMGKGESDMDAPWQNLLINRMGQIAPEVFSYLKTRDKELTEEQKKEIQETIEQARKTAVETAAKEASEHIRKITGQAPKQLPAPKEESKTETPQAQAQAQPQPEQPKTEMTEQEKEEYIKGRVNFVLDILSREIEIRPQKAEWVEKAADELPEEILDSVLKAGTLTEFVSVIEKYIDENLMKSLTHKLLTDTAAAEWLAMQVKYLKEYIEEIKTERAEVAQQAKSFRDQANSAQVQKDSGGN